LIAQNSLYKEIDKVQIVSKPGSVSMIYCRKMFCRLKIFHYLVLFSPFNGTEMAFFVLMCR